MLIEQTSLPGVVVLTPRMHADERGWFCESFSQKEMIDSGLPSVWVQDNHSYSRRSGTLRGLHYQAPPRAQNKLVRCSRGKILDVAVDYRVGSEHFGRWIGVELSAENGRQLLIPVGFLHGFITLVDDTEVQYKCSEFYSPEHDRAIMWNDPDLKVDWGIVEPLMSNKDRSAPTMRNAASPFSLETTK